MKKVELILKGGNKYMLDTIDDKLTEDMIKKFHFILKDGTYSDYSKTK